MRNLALPAVVTLLMCVGMWYQSLTPEPVVAETPPVSVPDVEGYSVRDLEPGEAELTILPSDTRFVKRLYTAPDGRWFQITVVIGGASKSSIHRPELCLPAQGFQMMRPRSLAACGLEWRSISLVRAGSAPLGFAYMFFNGEGFRTASHVRRIFRDVWDRSVLNRIDRWVMVTLNAYTDDDRAIAEFLEKIGEISPCLH